MMLELLGTFRSRTPLAFGYGEEKNLYCAYLGMVSTLLSQLITDLHVTHNLEAWPGPFLTECQIPMWGVRPEILDHKPSILIPPI